MRGITKRFPGVLANDRVDFEAAAGEVHALLGENGAGKSTLSNILTGLYRPDEGSISLYGEPARFDSPSDAIDAGIGMVHQHFRLVPPFTVAENIILGEHRPEARSFVVHPRRIERDVADLGERYGIAVDPRARIWQLSVGEQQRVEILKALYREARILILDEPTAVLTPQEAESLFVTLRRMAEEGRTVIFISHKLHEVKAVADRVTVLRGGRAVATVDAAGATPRELAALMVGREVELARRVERAHAASRRIGPLRRRALASAATGARRRFAAWPFTFGRARSSASPGSPGTASGSWPRRSPGCGRASAVPSMSTTGSSAAATLAPRSPPESLTFPRTGSAPESRRG